MRYPGRAFAILLVGFFLLMAAPADGQDPYAVADATWGPHPCQGQVVTLHDPTLHERTSAIGRATGVEAHGPNPKTDWRLVRCEITVDPDRMALLDAESRCRVIVHEVGHLALHSHDEGGVMATPPDYFAPCARMRVQIKNRIADRTGTGWGDVRCGPHRNRAVICRVQLDTGNWVRYRAAIHPDRTFTITRIPSRRSHHGSTR